MALNQEEIVLSGVVFDGCSLDKGPDTGWKSSGISESDDEDSKHIADLLPKDPFGMEFNISLPIDPFGMEFNISLPRDPFGMDINIEATVAAITDWIEEIGLKSCEFESDEASEDKKSDHNKLYAELNFVWSSSMEFLQVDQETEEADAGLMTQSENGSSEDYNLLAADLEELMCFGWEEYENEHENDYNDCGRGAPADALFFALGYLGLQDLLSIERVCKSFRDAVQNDPLLWRNIHIDYPLSLKITDDHLLRLTNRAQGTLCSLSLEKCFKITNKGLKHVLESNLGLTKLSVPGCVRLKVEVILHDLKVFNSVAMPGIKHLRIADIWGATNQHFKEFKLLLGADEGKRAKNKPRFYRTGELYLSPDDDRAIDIESCPRCQQVTLVYDCPAESCQVNSHLAQTCRGCIVCIARCINCGCCLDDNTKYIETFCLDLLCFECLARLLECPDTLSISRHTRCHQTTSYYHVYLCG